MHLDPRLKRGRAQPLPGRLVALAVVLADPSRARQRRLGRGEPRDRHPERRTRHVVEAHRVAEARWRPDHRRARRRCRSSRSGRAERPFSTAIRISRRRPPYPASGTGSPAGSCAPRTAAGTPPSASSRLYPYAIWVRSLVPKLKNAAYSAISSAVTSTRAGPRSWSRTCSRRSTPAASTTRCASSLQDLACPASSFTWPTSGIMISACGSRRPPCARWRR